MQGSEALHTASVPTAFLSHASTDAELAQDFCRQLEDHGVRCWLAPRDLTAGQPYASEIVRGIEGCGAFVLLATATSVASRNVLNELEQAHRAGRALYTVMIGKPKLGDDVSYYIARLHWLESSTDSNLREVAAKLADVLHGEKQWEAVAAAPTFGRPIRYALPAFAGAAAAVLIGLIALAGGGFYLAHRVQRSVAQDYRSLGWTTLDAEQTRAGGPNTASGFLFLGDASQSFSAVQLSAVAENAPSGKSQAFDLNSQLPPQGTGQASIQFAIPAGTTRLHTTLKVPAEHTGQSFCVAQGYAVVDGSSLQPLGSPAVTAVSASSRCP